MSSSCKVFGIHLITVYDVSILHCLLATLEQAPGGSSYQWKYTYASVLGDTLSTVTKPGGARVDYYYDELDRVTYVTSGGATGALYANYNYNVNNQPYLVFDRLKDFSVNATDKMYAWNYAYDTEGRMTKEELATSGSSNYYSLGRLQLKYDRAGRRTDRGFFSNNRTNYLNLDTTQTYSYYTTNQQLSKIERTGASAQKARYAYDAGGRLTSQTLGNGAWTQYEYWASGALSKITHRKSSGTPAIFASVAYQYDKAGNVTKAILDDDALTYSGDATVTYAYDDAYRLTLEDCVPAGGSYRKAYRFKYEFDGVGNRTKLRYYNGSSTSTYTFEYSARNELTLMNDGTYDYQYSYDTRGNLVEKYVDQGEQYGIRITTYGWDAQDHLVSVDDELWQNDYLSWSWSVDYKYDHAGRRVAKSVNGGAWRWYFYDGLKVVAEGTSSSDKQYYTTAPGDPGGIICRDSTAGTNPLYYHYDRLGNVMAVSDSNGAPYALYTMGAFGYVLEKGTSTGYSSEHATDPQPYHLTTKEYDNDVGLYYFNARWYDLWSGRFVSRDSEWNPITSRYSYCIEDPVNRIDPEGANCIRIYHQEYEGSEKQTLYYDIKGNRISGIPKFQSYGWENETLIDKGLAGSYYSLDCLWIRPAYITADMRRFYTIDMDVYLCFTCPGFMPYIMTSAHRHNKPWQWVPGSRVDVPELPFRSKGSRGVLTPSTGTCVNPDTGQAQTIHQK